MTIKLGDQVEYTGPILLGTRWSGTVARLPVPHTSAEQQRRATDDRVMVKVPQDQVVGKPPKYRAVRVEHLKVVR